MQGQAKIQPPGNLPDARAPGQLAQSGFGLPISHRRTFAFALQATAHSDLPALRHPACAGQLRRLPGHGEPEASSTRRREELSVESVGGHGQTKGIVEGFVCARPGGPGAIQATEVAQATGGRMPSRRVKSAAAPRLAFSEVPEGVRPGGPVAIQATGVAQATGGRMPSRRVKSAAAPRLAFSEVPEGARSGGPGAIQATEVAQATGGRMPSRRVKSASRSSRAGDALGASDRSRAGRRVPRGIA
jgi:hypothetical protein